MRKNIVILTTLFIACVMLWKLYYFLSQIDFNSNYASGGVQEVIVIAECFIIAIVAAIIKFLVIRKAGFDIKRAARTSFWVLVDAVVPMVLMSVVDTNTAFNILVIAVSLLTMYFIGKSSYEEYLYFQKSA